MSTILQARSVAPSPLVDTPNVPVALDLQGLTPEQIAFLKEQADKLRVCHLLLLAIEHH